MVQAWETYRTCLEGLVLFLLFSTKLLMQSVGKYKQYRISIPMDIINEGYLHKGSEVIIALRKNPNRITV